MSDNVTAIKGFADLFSPDSDAFTHMEAVARETFSRYGFTELRTPIPVSSTHLTLPTKA